MLKKITLTILLSLFTGSIIFSQRQPCTISGIVIDDKTNVPISWATIFISGTHWGTMTDKKGNFILKDVPSGNHEIVVSIIGYEMLSKIINMSPDKPLRMIFRMNEKIYQMKEIQSLASSKEWKKNLEEFKKYFIGQTLFAEQCTIENENAVDFRKSGDTLFASSENPLTIINKALGYKLECHLIMFNYNSSNNIYNCITKTKFEDLSTENNTEKEWWAINRKTAYQNSFKRFLISLINNDFIQNGYWVIFKSSYYELELKNTDIILNRDELKNEYRFGLDGSLLVEFTPEEKTNYYFRRPLKSSIICLYNSVTLDQFGNTKEILPFRLTGFWAILGIADLLPEEYDEK